VQETKILSIQEKWKVKVLKHGKMSKRKGMLWKQFKEFEVFLLESGAILFYTQTPKSKKYGQESTLHRMYLDETVRIEDVQKMVTHIKQKGQTPIH